MVGTVTQVNILVYGRRDNWLWKKNCHSFLLSLILLLFLYPVFEFDKERKARISTSPGKLLLLKIFLPSEELGKLFSSSSKRSPLHRDSDSKTGEAAYSR